MSDKKIRLAPGETVTVKVRRKPKPGPPPAPGREEQRGILPVEGEPTRYIRRRKKMSETIIEFYDLGMRGGDGSYSELNFSESITPIATDPNGNLGPEYYTPPAGYHDRFTNKCLSDSPFTRSMPLPHETDHYRLTIQLHGGSTYTYSILPSLPEWKLVADTVRGQLVPEIETAEQLHLRVLYNTTPNDTIYGVWNITHEAFDTGDSTNYKVTTEPSYAAAAASLSIKSKNGGRVQVFLKPRSYMIFSRSAITTPFNKPQAMNRLPVLPRPLDHVPTNISEPLGLKLEGYSREYSRGAYLRHTLTGPDNEFVQYTKIAQAQTALGRLVGAVEVEGQIYYVWSTATQAPLQRGLVAYFPFP